MARDNEIVEDVRKLDFKPIDFVRAVGRHYKEIKYSLLKLVIIGEKTLGDNKIEEYRILIYRPLIGLYHSHIPVKMRVQYAQIVNNSKEDVVEWTVEYDNFIKWFNHSHIFKPLPSCLKEFIDENSNIEVAKVGRLTL